MEARRSFALQVPIEELDHALMHGDTHGSTGAVRLLVYEVQLHAGLLRSVCHWRRVLETHVVMLEVADEDELPLGLIRSRDVRVLIQCAKSLPGTTPAWCNALASG